MNFSTIFFIQLSITFILCISAVVYDIRKNDVPLPLTYGLLFFGLASNFVLSLISANVNFILASLISMVITFVVTYLLWKLKMWGGGDVLLFTAIATVIPSGVNVNFLNIFPHLSVYPFGITVMINSILVSFPFLIIFLVRIVIKEGTFKDNPSNLIVLLNIKTLTNFIHSILNKNIPIKDLKEGNIVNNFYFDNPYVARLIKENDGNLEVFKNNDDNGSYYFKSISAGGITEKDMYLIKILSEQNFITDLISVKVSYPFTPAILGGFIIAIFFGDIMMIFTKNFFMVI